MPTSAIPASSSSNFKTMLGFLTSYFKLEQSITAFLKTPITPATPAIPATGSSPAVPAVPADTTNASTAYASMLTNAKTFILEEAHLLGDLIPYQIQGLRIQVINVDGTTLLDTYSPNNAYDNIDKPASNFATTGKYLINSNQGNRVYNQIAFISAKGISELIQLSRTTNTVQVYLAQRIGSQIEPIANIVVSCDCSTSIIKT
jgi:hypothetical protein